MRHRKGFLPAFILLVSCFVSEVARADGVEATSLRLMHEKNVISDEEYEAARKDLNDTLGSRAGDATSVAVGKFSTVIYGFVETDVIHDSTQSFSEQSANGLVARGDTPAGQSGRTELSIRNSRFGFRVKAPEQDGLRLSGQLEMDFFAGQVGVGYPAGAGQQSETSFYENPLLRVRHLNLKLETPVVDLLLGQSWELFGFQPQFHPNTVQIQGVVGEVYSRTPQVRLSRMIGDKDSAVQVELAVAAMRPIQRDSGTPEGQAGLRLAINDWTGAQTIGSTGKGVNPAGLAISGDYRHIRVPQLAAGAKDSNERSASSLSLDAFLPLLPASAGEHGAIVPGTGAGALSLTGNYVIGRGDSDLYSGLTGGVGFPALPNPTNLSPAPAYAQNLDNGIATYDPSGQLQFVQWTSYIAGLQYYLPGMEGKVWLSATYFHINSPNMKQLVAPANLTKVLVSSDMIDGALFFDVLSGMRLGLEFARMRSTYGDEQKATNDRVQGSTFFLF